MARRWAAYQDSNHARSVSGWNCDSRDDQDRVGRLLPNALDFLGDATTQLVLTLRMQRLIDTHIVPSECEAERSERVTVPPSNR
jgi:hypothetical protein